MKKKVVHFSQNGDGYCACENYYVDVNTTDVTKVTCGNCKRTKVYKEAVKKLENERAKKSQMPKLSYVERQDIWIKENNLKIGDKVKVIRAAQSREDGWLVRWNLKMTEFIGETLILVAVNDNGLLLGDEARAYWFYYPYFVLEPVKDTAASVTTQEFADEIIEDLEEKQKDSEPVDSLSLTTDAPLTDVSFTEIEELVVDAIGEVDGTYCLKIDDNVSYWQDMESGELFVVTIQPVSLVINEVDNEEY